MLIKGMIVALAAVFGGLDFLTAEKLDSASPTTNLAVFDCTGCKQIGTAGYSPGTGITLAFFPEDEPLIGQEHGNGACDPTECEEQTKCRINGTLRVFNNSGEDLKVGWANEMGRVLIEHGTIGLFSTGFRQQDCNSAGVERIVVMDGGDLYAFYDFLCSSCVAS